MKKNIVLPAMIALVIIACTIFMSDGLTYLIVSIMALAIMGTIKRYRSKVMKMTRWAKANPKKAQGLIAGLQMVLMALGIFAGNNFNELGYKFSDTTAFVFSTIIVTGFLSVHFLPKRSTITIPREVNRRRLVYTSIALSSFVMMVLTGNRMRDLYPNSPITHAIEAIDQAIFPDNIPIYTDLDDRASETVSSKNHKQELSDESPTLVVFASYNLNDKESIAPSTDLKKESKANLKAVKRAMKFEKKKARMMNHLWKHRMAAAAMSAGLAALFIILLIAPLCAGICLIVGGITGDIAAINILFGAIIAGASIWGITEVSKARKKTKLTTP